MHRWDRFQVIAAVPRIAVMAIVAILVTSGSRPVFGQEAETKPEPTTPISITGQATDPDEKPVAGAKITLVSTNGIDKHLGEATTDSAGRYVFRDVALPVKRGREGSVASGTFQVFGVADGMGIAWHGMRFYHLQQRPETARKSAQDHSFYQGETIEINLAFRRAKELTGHVNDDRGKPVQNVKVYLSTLDYLDLAGREDHHNFREFWAMYIAPAKYREAITGEDGRFAIAGLPEDSVVVVRVQHPEYADQMFLAAITDSDIADYRRIVNGTRSIQNGNIEKSPLAIVARSTRRAIVRILNDDDRRPATNVRVGAVSTDISPPTASTGKTDEMGRVELRLPPGAYRLFADPPRGSNYVRKYVMITIAEEPAEQAFDMDLNVGCILILEAIDAESGAGVPGAIFMGDIERQGRKGRSQVQSSTSIVDNPVTNANGELRAVVLPGTRNYSVEPPKGYRSIANFPTEVKCVAGETVRVKFELEKQPTE